MKKLVLLLFVAIALVSCEKTEVANWDSYTYTGSPGQYVVEIEFTGVTQRTVDTYDLWTKNVNASEDFIPSIKVVSKTSLDPVKVSIIKNGVEIYSKIY